MRDKKKRIVNLIFLAAVFLLTVVGVLRGENIDDLGASMMKTDGRWLLGAVFCVLACIALGALIIRIMMGRIRQPVGFGKCFLLSGIGYFFGNITPFAGGGPPMQIYYMKKEKVPISVSSLIMLLVTLMYKMVLVAVGFGLIIFGQGLLGRYFHGVLPLFGVGLFLNSGFCFLLILFIFHPTLAKKGMIKGLGWLEKKRLMKHKEGRVEKLSAAMDRYKSTAAFFKDHVPVMILVFILSVVQRFVLFGATWFVFRAFRLSGTSPGTILILQASISVSADMLPLPGGMGASETLFLRLFESVFGAALVLPGMVLSRGISYYVELFLCAVLTIIGHFYFGRRREKNEEKLSEGA
mgnify:CR=1 FL=1